MPQRYLTIALLDHLLPAKLKFSRQNSKWDESSPVPIAADIPANAYTLR
ncbi:MAG: hypothetical protein MUF49_25065 [Oculatellaceae cyanobacterium Prado106]|nr:hypothetical protein [Oculatellaceae cyanobacterium Prado106]